MSRHIHTHLLLAGVLLASSATVPAAGDTPGSVRSGAADSEEPSAGGWLGRDGQPLPFAGVDEALEFLATARVVGQKELSSGVNRPLRLDLEKDGVRARAIFRTVDVTNVADRREDRRKVRSLSDNWAHEIAAWELSRLLGLDHVPPVVRRSLGGRRGSIQLWIERAESEGDRLKSGKAPASPARWYRERQAMAVFDNLIYNPDRHAGNSLVDERGKVWFIDHTRAFSRLPELLDPQRIRICDRDLWERLRALNLETLDSHLGDWIDRPARRAILARRDLLVRHLERLIAELGEDRVLIG